MSRLRSLGRRLKERDRPVILMYHRVAEIDIDPWELCVTPKHFAQQMAYLKRHRTPLPMTEFVERHANGTLPDDAVAVTFDDGYLDNLIHAKPALVAEDVPATLFVVTGSETRGRPFWWDELADLILTHPGPLDDEIEIAGTAIPLRWEADSAPDKGRPWRGWEPPRNPRQASFTEVRDWLRLLSPSDRDDRLAWLHERLGPTNLNGNAAMTEAQLREFGEGSLIEFGGHTVSHPALPSLTPKRRREEIEGCREELTRLLGTPPAGFAYPYGEFDDGVRREVARSGFSWACTTRAGAVTPSSELFALPRRHVCDWNGHRFARWLRTVQ